MSALELPPSTDSVPVARQFARRAAGSSAADVDTVVLLVSEVVTNAVLHARSDIRLDVQAGTDTVRVEVYDASPVEPRLHHFRLTSGTGRGLRMLEQLARRWGVEPDPAARRQGRLVRGRPAGRAVLVLLRRRPARGGRAA